MPARSSSTVARKAATAIAALCTASCYVAAAAAQTSNSNSGQTPALQGTSLQGTGPRVEVQTSPNGTIDVGGAGGTDLNMTGENFRGSFGSSRLQPGWSIAPSPPRSSFQVPFAAPNFNPSLPGPSAPSDSTTQADEADREAYPDLILPRFRGALGGSTTAGGTSSGGASRSGGQRHRGETPSAHADAWRYRYSSGRWWYWQPSESWLYWDGSQWQAFAPRP